MADLIKKTCPRCDGTGSVTSPPPGGSGDCPQCGGAGAFTWEADLADVLSSIGDVLDKCNDILDKCNDILEALP